MDPSFTSSSRADGVGGGAGQRIAVGVEPRLDAHALGQLLAHHRVRGRDARTAPGSEAAESRFTATGGPLVDADRARR